VVKSLTDALIAMAGRGPMVIPTVASPIVNMTALEKHKEKMCSSIMAGKFVEPAMFTDKYLDQMKFGSASYAGEEENRMHVGAGMYLSSTPTPKVRYDDPDLVTGGLRAMVMFYATMVKDIHDEAIFSQERATAILEFEHAVANDRGFNSKLERAKYARIFLEKYAGLEHALDLKQRYETDFNLKLEVRNIIAEPNSSWGAGQNQARGGGAARRQTKDRRRSRSRSRSRSPRARSKAKNRRRSRSPPGKGKDRYDAKPKPKQICYSRIRLDKKCTYGDSCRFDHKCPSCGSDHPASECSHFNQGKCEKALQATASRR
jgi:hypothetical protein